MTTVKKDPFVTPPPSEKGSVSPTPPEDVVVYDPITVPPLAERTKAFDTGYGPITDALCNLFRIRGKAHRSESLDEVATQPSVYDTPQAEFFQPRADWENIDAFDPKFRWSWREEQVAIRKIDFKVLSWVCLMFFALDMDRGNLANATADNILDDLRLTQADYNLGNTLFRVGFLAAELPSQLVSKRLGPDRWIPLTVVIFSIISASQFWLSGRTSFLLTRFLIAIFQGGFIPDNILYLSYWYNKYDLPVRLAFFWTMLSVVDIVTGFMAVGLLKMRGVLGYEGWRWMFLIEGIITLLIGIASFWMMPVSPAKTKTRFRKNGYITDREAKIIVNRTIRDDPGKGEMHNRQALSLSMIWKSFKDYQLWPIYLIGLTFGIPAVPLGQYLQLSFRQLGFNTTEANLLSIPNQVLTIINLVIITVVSELVGNRSFIAMSENIWMLPCIIALVALPTITGWQYFAISTVLLGYPYVHAIQVGWCSRNSGSIRTRTVSASLYNMFVQTSGIIGSNIYQASDRPRYFKGNSALLGIIAFNLVILYPGTYLYYTWENKRRDKKWDALSEDQKLEYLRTTTDEGCQRLDFRFAK